MKPGTPSAINPHLQTGAHALGALPDAERAEFEAHLSGCRNCADEVAGFSETAARLGRAVDHLVPSDLRPHVLQAIRDVRQTPPAYRFEKVHSQRQGLSRAAALVAAACVVAAGVAGVNSALTSPTVMPVAPPPHTQVGDLLAAPDMRLVTAGVSEGSAAISRDRDEMLVLANGLRALPRDQVYQLWLVDEHGPRSAGTTRPAGEMTSLFVRGIAGAREATFTVEPADGSPSPTSSPVLTVVLR
ncbi:anti-sigma factor domain-containing protein [Lentzea sp. NPDC058436]|uniref:anti-sigma factor n=1 Tax=Lentzea sp. NPDC058436 TaxID=3346499 RepID=UPI00365C511E